jgi:hypothetical protein
LPKRRIRWRRPPRHSGDSAPGRDGSSALDYLDVFDIFGGVGDNPLLGITVVIGIAVFAVVAWFFVIPALLALLDIAVLVALIVAGIVSRVLMHRPWEIEAVSADDRLGWRVLGWRRSARAIDSVCTTLSQGMRPPTDAPPFH